MSGQISEAEQHHLLLLVEAAQRSGRTESEITELVDAATEADAELDRAA